MVGVCCGCILNIVIVKHFCGCRYLFGEEVDGTAFGVFGVIHRGRKHSIPSSLQRVEVTKCSLQCHPVDPQVYPGGRARTTFPIHPQNFLGVLLPEEHVLDVDNLFVCPQNSTFSHHFRSQVVKVRYN